jgi:hypothetical protein
MVQKLHAIIMLRHYRLLFILFCLMWPSDIFATEWQWSVIVRDSPENNGQSRAFLWIPPDCMKVRGVIIAQHNMEEIMILENPTFRKTLSELGFAEIWCAPFFDHLFRFDQGAGETFNGMMADLASLSGYEELNYVPVIGIGHSAAASWPYYFAAWNPDRTLAAISVSGQWPYVRSPQYAPDIWGDRNIDFIPCIETMGEYESANTWSNEGLKERQQHPLMPLSMLACPAEGHFAASDKKVEYLSLYIRKAVQYRMPEIDPGSGPPVLKPIDPTQTGWLVDRWRKDQEPKAPAAPVKEYKGNPADAFWFFDEEMAMATEAYQSAYRGLKGQLIGYMQNGQKVVQNNSHLQVNMKFLPEDDGITFRLKGFFYDTVPGGSPRLPGWAGRPVGSSVGHASGETPVSIDRICGPFIKTEPEEFVLQFDRTGFGQKKSVELVFVATHPGDAEYKPAVQQANMMVPVKNTEGITQTITFPRISDQVAKRKSVRLRASSSAGVRVYYYILSGPAEIEGDKLRFTKIPPHSKFPVKVTVVAWQYGRSLEPKLQSAEPVEISFNIRK